jgi:hypothetical protein
MSRTTECRPSATDQQISVGPTAVFEFEPNPVLGAHGPDGTGIASDALGRKPSNNRCSTTRRGTIRTGAPSPSAIAARSTVATGRAVGVRTPQGGEQLAGPVHIDPELVQNRCAIGPDGDGPAGCLHIGPPFEDGDVMAVAQ